MLVGIIADAHIPFQNKRAYEFALSILKDLGIESLVLAGDFADFLCVSSHDKDPSIGVCFSDEIDIVQSELTRLKDLFKNVTLCSGNHEQRLEKYAQRNAPALYRMATIDKILNLDIIGIKYIPYGHEQAWVFEKSELFVRHEPLAGKADASLRKAGRSHIVGHHHRIEVAHAVSLDGQRTSCFFLPCLADVESKAMAYVKNPHQWQLGFGIYVMDEDTGQWFVEVIEIKKNICDRYQALCFGNIYTEV
jgi:predicted phosphodiesterase